MQVIAKTATRVKRYPNGYTTKQVASKPIFSVYAADEDIEADIAAFVSESVNDMCEEPVEVDDTEEKPRKRNSDNEDDENNRAAYVARRRAVQAIRDIALCNTFDFFATLTLDENKISRYDPDEIMKKMKYTLSNLSQRKGLKYLLVPEYHKKREDEETPAIHFHGLLIAGEIRIEPAMNGSVQRTDRNGLPIYNCPDWPFGFSVLTKLDQDNYFEAVNYVTKYITKQGKKIMGKYYLVSRSLQKKPEIIPILNAPSLEDVEDAEKLRDGRQRKFHIYGDVYILSERVDSYEGGTS